VDRHRRGGHLPLDHRLPPRPEAALHTALGFADRTFGATPGVRVRVRADFQQALRFNDAVDVTLGVVQVGRTSVRYALTITHEEAPAVDGEIVSCLIDRETRRAIPWPDDIRAALESAGDVSAPPP
jgi:acyl-CoA thioester hydrolase